MSFGGIRALDGCSFDVDEGSVTGLIGPNGSGKTTAFNVITGYEQADSGRVVMRGRAITRPDPCRMYRLGLARTFQQSRDLARADRPRERRRGSQPALVSAVRSAGTGRGSRPSA